MKRSPSGQPAVFKELWLDPCTHTYTFIISSSLFSSLLWNNKNQAIEKGKGGDSTTSMHAGGMAPFCVFEVPHVLSLVSN